ncbi:hypothetical protein YC2023_046420 [Brassica napus]
MQVEVFSSGFSLLYRWWLADMVPSVGHCKAACGRSQSIGVALWASQYLPSVVSCIIKDSESIWQCFSLGQAFLLLVYMNPRSKHPRFPLHR